MPAAIPVCAAGTFPISVARFGAWNRPAPTPTTSRHTTSTSAADESTNASNIIPTVSTARPAAARGLLTALRLRLR